MARNWMTTNRSRLQSWRLVRWLLEHTREGGCTHLAEYTTGKTDSRSEGKTAHQTAPRFALSCQTTCAPAGCVKTGNGGARKICYDTDSVTRKQVDSTMNKCESWITMSGSFCIVATEYTMAAQEIYKEFATLPSNRSAETAAVAAYRLLRTIPNSELPQQVVQLEIRT